MAAAAAVRAAWPSLTRTAAAALRPCQRPWLRSLNAACGAPARVLSAARPVLAVRAFGASASAWKDLENGPPPKPDSASPANAPPAAETKLSATQRAKALWNKYGWVAIVVHGTVYTTTLSTMALLIHNGVDMVRVFERIGLDRWVDLKTLNPSLGTLMVAFLATKLTSPVRMLVTASMTPIVARWLQRWRLRHP